ncbi:MAG: pyridoxal-dependent decarboxylase [Acidobacteriota bacterium]|nr:pyridoxal-dependent decarboxylase [Acidobacteriota bacterium]
MDTARLNADETTDPLGLGVERFRALAHGVVDRVADHWAELDAAAVVGRADATALAALSGPAPRAPGDIEELLQVLATQALPNMQHAAHPRYFARVPSPASLTGILGDWLGIGYNAIASSWSGGSGPSQLELLVVDWLRELIGLPPGAEGVLVSGGSLGNITALAAARAAGYDGSVLLSDQTHASIGRGLRVLGYAREQITVIPTGADYRWEAGAVRAAIGERNRGRAIVIGTAGYTNTGGVDPLDELGELCGAFDLWFHVDGAYGAPAALAPSGAAALVGIERADSLTLDPHKWLFQPYDLGCVLVRRAGALEACFAISPEYLRDVQSTDVEEVDMHNRGLELSRRARAVKLWLTLASHGTDAIAAAIERSIVLAQQVQALLERDPEWEIVTPAQLGVITFARRRLDGPGHAERARRLTESGFAAVSCTELRGGTVYRLCLINPLTTLDDVTATLARL